MRRSTVLLIDDEIDLVTYYQAELTAAGIDADIATHPLEGLELLSTRAYDVVVTDLRMPVMSGLQLASYVRANELNRTAKIIVVSGLLDADVVAKAERIGVVQCLNKPLEMVNLLDLIRSSIAPQPQRETLIYAPPLVEVFRAAAAEVLRFYLGGDVTTLEPTVKAGPLRDGHAGAIIPLFGRRVFGSLGLVFDHAFFDVMVAALFDDAKVSSTLFAEILGEACSQIAEAVRSNLDRHHALIHLGAPQVVVGEDTKTLTHLTAGQVVTIPCRFRNATCAVEFCVGDGRATEHYNERRDLPIFL